MKSHKVLPSSRTRELPEWARTAHHYRTVTTDDTEFGEAYMMRLSRRLRKICYRIGGGWWEQAEVQEHRLVHATPYEE